MTESPGQRLDGGLITDQRSADEAVIIMWLVPVDETGETLDRAVTQHVIVGVLHICRGAGSGMEFNGKEMPLLTSPLGISMLPVRESDVGEELQGLVERLRKRLSRPQTDGMAVLNGVASHFNIHVFKKGEGTVGASWALNFAGRHYPLRGGKTA